MHENNFNKRRLFRILSWTIVGLYVALNVGVITLNTPLSALVIVLPIINLALIGGWFLLRAFFNDANDKIKHNEYLESRPSKLPPPQYGNASNPTYVPDVTIPSDVFDAIEAKPDTLQEFDVSLGDYLKPGRFIIFHNDQNYGSILKLKVNKIAQNEKILEASFTKQH